MLSLEWYHYLAVYIIGLLVTQTLIAAADKTPDPPGQPGKIDLVVEAKATAVAVVWPILSFVVVFKLILRICTLTSPK